MMNEIDKLKIKIVNSKLANKPFGYIRMLQQKLDKLIRAKKDGTL